MYQHNKLGRQTFSVAGPTVWNSHLDHLRDETEDIFQHSLKTLLFGQYQYAQRFRGLLRYNNKALHKFTFYLLTSGQMTWIDLAIDWVIYWLIDSSWVDLQCCRVLITRWQSEIVCLSVAGHFSSHRLQLCQFWVVTTSNITAQQSAGRQL